VPYVDIVNMVASVGMTIPILHLARREYTPGISRGVFTAG
jgi:hypothetical protein